jgi:hypothetical protein
VATRGQSGKASAGGDPPRRRSPAERKGFLLRLPPRLLNDMKRWAAQDLRSVNGQIEFVLTEALKRRKSGK